MNIKHITKRKYLVLFILLAILIVSSILVFKYNVMNSHQFFDPSYKNEGTALIAFYWFLAFLTIIGTVLVYYFAFIHKIKFYLLVMIMILFIGLISIFILSPNTIPDEFVHYQSAYKVSNNILGVENNSTNMLAASDDFAVSDNFNYLISSDNYTNIIKGFIIDDPNATFPAPLNYDASANVFCGYFFSGLGIAFMRSIGGSPLMVYYCGRIFNFLFFLMLATLAVRKIPFGKVTLSVIALLPIMLQQAASYSYDAIINGLSLFFIAYCLFIAFSKRKPKWWDWLLLFISIALIIPSKIVYVPLAGLLFLIPTQKYGNLKIKIIIYAVIIVGAILTTIFLLNNFTGNLFLEEKGLNTFSISSIINNPLNCLTLIFDTINTNFMFYMSSAFCGHLGWLEVSVPDYFTIFYLIVLIISLVCNKQENNLCKKYFISNRIWMIIISIFSILLIYLSMMIACTPELADTIEGIQGRYFLPILPVFLIAFYQQEKTISFKNDYSRHLLFVEILLNLLIFLRVFTYAI